VNDAPRAHAEIVAVVRARDEAGTVADVVAGLPRSVGGHPVRALVVDDGSEDGTGAVAARAGAEVLRLPGPGGGAAALRAGLLAALAREPVAIVTLDGDGQHDSRDVARLVAPILQGRADVVQATGDPAARRPERRALDALLSALTRRRIHDSGNGLRALDPDHVAALLPAPGSRVPHAEIALAAHRRRLRVRRVPVQIAPRRHRASSTAAGATLLARGAADLAAARRRGQAAVRGDPPGRSRGPRPGTGGRATAAPPPGASGAAAAGAAGRLTSRHRSRRVSRPRGAVDGS
jgi:hypothetical protein